MAPVACLLDREWLIPFAYRIDVSPFIVADAGGIVLVASLAEASYQDWTATWLSPATRCNRGSWAGMMATEDARPI